MPTTFKFLLIGIMLVLAGCYLFVSSTAGLWVRSIRAWHTR